MLPEEDQKPDLKLAIAEIRDTVQRALHALESP
jgi:hypothetical protein